VPRDHPVIPPSNLEAEASGLLDRLMGVLQDNSRCVGFLHHMAAFDLILDIVMPSS